MIPFSSAVIDLARAWVNGDDSAKNPLHDALIEGGPINSYAHKELKWHMKECNHNCYLANSIASGKYVGYDEQGEFQMDDGTHGCH